MEEKKEAKTEVNIEKKPSKKDLKINELICLLQRLQADFENYKKRVEREACEYKKYASHELIVKLLPILDSFEHSLKNTENKEEFVNGVKLIYAQLVDVLEKDGLKKIEAVNQKLDPFKHEALMQEKSDKDGIVLEELQKGYMLCDKVIRHSKVKVGRNK